MIRWREAVGFGFSFGDFRGRFANKFFVITLTPYRAIDIEHVYYGVLRFRLKSFHIASKLC